MSSVAFILLLGAFLTYYFGGKEAKVEKQTPVLINNYYQNCNFYQDSVSLSK